MEIVEVKINVPPVEVPQSLLNEVFIAANRGAEALEFANSQCFENPQNAAALCMDVEVSLIGVRNLLMSLVGDYLATTVFAECKYAKDKAADSLSRSPYFTVRFDPSAPLE